MGMSLVLSIAIIICYCEMICGMARVDPSSITVSGISSGAAIALQLEIAYSSTISGAALIAGVPYYCARNNVGNTPECMDFPTLVPIEQLELNVREFAQQRFIDLPGNLTKHSLYLFSGILDTVVNQGSVRLIEKMARDFGVTNILTEYGILAEHCLPTDDWGYPCITLASPYINNCEYDFAGIAFEHLYGKLNLPVSPIDRNIITLEQKQFIPGQLEPSSISMDNHAYAYVPTACFQSQNTCKLHVSLHGCLQGVELVGQNYILHAGLNRWAESNNIIVLYPQAIASFTNLEGCWDWWGYTNGNYANKYGLQLATINNMISSYL